jgi:mRNA-degrading endonuclease RelE of RelBE toxin-antitoxin system
LAEPFTITITRGAEKDIAWFKARERNIILAGLEVHLKHRPTLNSRQIKAMRPNPVAKWELRLGDLRVLYDVDAEKRTVTVQVVGEKQGNQLRVQGKEYNAHESD